MSQAGDATALERSASGPWTDLGLTLPIFLGYHLGVIWLPARNAADWVTRELVHLAEYDMAKYALLTLGIGATYVGTLLMLGRGRALNWSRFFWIGMEGILYAVAMRLVAGYAVGRLYLAAGVGGLDLDRVASLVMSLGAGFYEEIAFRVILFGFGWRLIKILFPLGFAPHRVLMVCLWAVVSSAIFSGWHHVGELGEPLDLRTFTFRFVCGLVFTAIYKFRGFAPAVWTHALYDIWVLVPAAQA